MNSQLAKNIHWVGFVDWSVRDFHSFDTFRGATYNSYLIQDEKTALIDAVKGPFVSHLLEHISAWTDPAKIDYIVCNHAEPDHSGALPELMAKLPQCTLLCNEKCRETLSRYYQTQDWKIQVVTPEDKISLGNRTLTFVNTPMVHWPESMFTYIPEDELLFSMDAFGQHLATSERFDDQYELETIMSEAKSYYANIVNPYNKQVLRTLELAAKLPIRMIAPSHGLIWRTHLDRIVRAYQDWASEQQKSKILILFDSMWESTTQMAQAIYDGAVAQTALNNTLVDIQFMHVRKTSFTRIATEMMDASAVALGTATLNREMMPHLCGLLCYLRGLKFSAKTAFAFGTGGWAPAGVNHLDQWIKEVGWTTLREPVIAQFKPTNEILDQCRQAGASLAEKAVK